MWNDRETEIDLVGHARVARTITTLIREDRLSPLTIGVYGDWGAGKSSVLKLIEKDLEKDDKVCCLVFNGWLFQGYDDAKSTLMEAIISELRKRQPTNEVLKQKAREMLRRIDWLKLAKRTAGLAFSGLTGIPDPAMLSGLLQKLGGLLTQPSEAIGPDQLKGLASAVKDSVKESEGNTIPDEIIAFRKDFEDLLKTAKIDRLVVLLDDLDRCLPETAIDVLEAMRLFLYVPGTVFIIAADEKLVAYAVGRHFKELPVTVGHGDYTRNYLEKLVQVPFRLPPLGKSETRVYVTLLLADYALRADPTGFDKCVACGKDVLLKPWAGSRLDEQVIREAGCAVTEGLKQALLLADRISNALAEGLQGNPRRIKRFLNTLMVRIRIAEAQGIGDSVRLDELAKLMLVERFQERVFEQLLGFTAQSPDGRVKALTNFEDHARSHKEKGKAGKPKESEFPEEWREDDWLLAWAKLDPPLGNVDLRPYFFVSREKTPGFASDLGLGAELEILAERLVGGKALVLAGQKGQIRALAAPDARRLFDYLADRARRASSWKTRPPEFEGLCALCKERQELQENLVAVLEDMPIGELGAWAAAGMKAVLTNAAAAARYGKLAQKWLNQTDNKGLQTAVKNLSEI